MGGNTLRDRSLPAAVRRRLRTRAVCALALAAGLAAPLCQATPYRWVDRGGDVHYSDSLPANYSGSAYEELDDQGRVVKRVAGPAGRRLQEEEAAKPNKGTHQAGGGFKFSAGSGTTNLAAPRPEPPPETTPEPTPGPMPEPPRRLDTARPQVTAAVSVMLLSARFIAPYAGSSGFARRGLMNLSSLKSAWSDYLY